jgi:hypothetical protein
MGSRYVREETSRFAEVPLHRFDAVLMLLAFADIGSQSESSIFWRNALGRSLEHPAQRCGPRAAAILPSSLPDNGRPPLKP